MITFGDLIIEASSGPAGGVCLTIVPGRWPCDERGLVAEDEMINEEVISERRHLISHSWPAVSA
jgi:hypothetical protein